MEVNNIRSKTVQISPDLAVGGNQIIMMVGPCSVESAEQTFAIAKVVEENGGHVLRGGAYKPRTSPHTFSGLGLEGLKILRQAANNHNLLVVTEALGVEHVGLVDEFADIIQIGSRNMQHFPLLWAAGETKKPVLLKRGFMSTIEEWVSAADHIRARGNEHIILCERGIRGFDPSTRNIFDVNAIPLAKQLSGLPVIGDPSHATGRRDLVLPAARAAIAAGADGLIVETHPDPPSALSDPDQAVPIDQVALLFAECRRIANAVDRHL